MKPAEISQEKQEEENEVVEESKIEVEEELSNYQEDFNDSLGGGGIE